MNLMSKFVVLARRQNPMPSLEQLVFMAKQKTGPFSAHASAGKQTGKVSSFAIPVTQTIRAMLDNHMFQLFSSTFLIDHPAQYATAKREKRAKTSHSWPFIYI